MEPQLPGIRTRDSGLNNGAGEDPDENGLDKGLLLFRIVIGMGYK